METFFYQQPDFPLAQDTHQVWLGYLAGLPIPSFLVPQSSPHPQLESILALLWGLTCSGTQLKAFCSLLA